VRRGGGGGEHAWECDLLATGEPYPKLVHRQAAAGLCVRHVMCDMLKAVPAGLSHGYLMHV
jgi:hypothetical protein